MRTIYLVTRGECSDYHVVCACESESQATECASLLNGDDNGDDVRVESFHFLDPDEKLEQITTHSGMVVFGDDLTTTEPEFWEEKYWNVDSSYPYPPPYLSVQILDAPPWKRQGRKCQGTCFCVCGQSANEVAWLITDRVARFKSGEWKPEGTHTTTQTAE